MTINEAISYLQTIAYICKEAPSASAFKIRKDLEEKIFDYLRYQDVTAEPNKEPNTTNDDNIPF